MRMTVLWHFGNEKKARRRFAIHIVDTKCDIPGRSAVDGLFYGVKDNKIGGV